MGNNKAQLKELKKKINEAKNAPMSSGLSPLCETACSDYNMSIESYILAGCFSMMEHYKNCKDWKSLDDMRDIRERISSGDIKISVHNTLLKHER